MTHSQISPHPPHTSLPSPTHSNPIVNLPTAVQGVQSDVLGVIGGLCAVAGVLFFALIMLWRMHTTQLLILERLGMMQEVKGPSTGSGMTTRQPNLAV